MEHTFESLRKLPVAELRNIAKDIAHDALRGYTTMHKEQLLPAVCAALAISVHHEVVGLDKSTIKAQIRELKSKRAAALEAHDREQLRVIRRRVRQLKRKIRKAMV